MITRAQLLREIWGYSSDVMSRTVDMHIMELRRKLEARPDEPAPLSHRAEDRVSLHAGLVSVRGARRGNLRRLTARTSRELLTEHERDVDTRSLRRRPGWNHNAAADFPVDPSLNDSMVNRREFLGITAGAGATLALTPELLRALQRAQRQR